MSETNHITAWCSVSNGLVRLNGSETFRSGAANAADFLADLYRHLHPDYPRFFKMDALCKLGWLASELLLSEFDASRYKPEEVGVVLLNANASLDTDIRYWATVRDFPSPSVFIYTLPNIVIGEICIRNNFKGESAFFVSESMDPALTEFYVNDLMERTGLRACICGWVDILGDDYNATLVLVEKNIPGTGQLFSGNLIHAIFEGELSHE